MCCGSLATSRRTCAKPPPSTRCPVRRRAVTHRAPRCRRLRMSTPSTRSPTRGQERRLSESAASLEPYAAAAQAAHADHRQPVRRDCLRPRCATSSSTRCRAASRSTPSTPRRAATPPSCAARRRTRAMTWSSPSAATARSTKPPTACSARPRRCAACPAARPTCSARCSASPASWSTRPSTCSRWPTTGARARSTSASSTAAASRSPPGSASTRASSSASTRSPRLKARFGAVLLHLGGRLAVHARATSCARRGC